MSGFVVVKNEVNPGNEMTNGALIDGGVSAPSEYWGVWELTGGGFEVTHGAYLERINANKPSYADENDPPVGWALQGSLYVPLGVSDIHVWCYAIFWTP